MGAARAAAFDQEAKRVLLDAYGSGPILLQVVGRVVWGI